MYAQRDESGKITALYRWPNNLAREWASDAEIEVFKESLEASKPSRLDVLEKALIKKGLINPDDLKQVK